jgi:hypothetical protein
MGSVAIRTTRVTRAAGLFAVVLCVAVLAGCGSEDFKNKPRPASALEITGVIQKDKVTISPDQFGAGPILLTISNQTKEAHTVTLEGESLRERVGPINPLDTATIQANVDTGTYEVRAGSSQAVAQEIQPAELDVGESRGDSNDQLLQP